MLLTGIGRRDMRQKLLALLLALALAFGGLTACGSGGEGENGDTPSGESEGGDEGEGDD